MNNPMQFRHGQKRTFISTRTFTMGSDGVTIPEGSEIEFDGTFVSHSGLAPTMMPQLRGAIRAGWLVPQEVYDPNDQSASIPQSAGVQMRAADGGNPMDPKPRHAVNTDVEAEEREVDTVERHASATRDRNVENYRRKRTPRTESTAGTRYEGGGVEPQEEIEVPGVKFQTVAGEKAKKTSTNITHAGSAISAANKVKIKPGKGRTREELIRDAIARGGLTDDELAEYEEELATMRMSHGVVMTPTPPKVVGHVAAPQRQQREGFDITGSVGGGTEIADMGGTGATGEETVTEVEGIKFTNTNGPKRGVRLVDRPHEALPPADDAMCRKIAKAICADFPDNYVFTDPIRKKIARLQADYDDRPDVIRAVAAAETDGEVKRRLVEEFPEAFG